MDGDGAHPELDPQGTTFDAPSPTPAGDAEPAVADLEVGQRLGRYKLLARIGGGAMGVVWRARDPQLDRDIAIKVVHPTLARIPDAAQRLLREARALAKVQHSGVVAVHDAGQDGDRLFLAMELIEGTTLGAILRQRRPADQRDWRAMVARMIAAGTGLAAAHAAGVLHRDFKPDNVLVSAAGRVCVADFGLAEIVAGAPRRPSMIDAADSLQLPVSADSLTTTGAVVGTPLYMSPEQLRSGVVDARSDQFGFCVAAYEAVYGERPFAVVPRPEQQPAAVLLAEIEAGRIRPAPRGTRVPSWVHDAIVRGLAAAPDARWPDLPALLAALSPPPRRRLMWLALALIPLAIVAGAIAITLRRRAAEGPAAIQLVALPMWSHAVSSADGRTIAYADDDRVYVRDVAAPAAAPRGLPMGGPIDHVEIETADRVVASIPAADGIQLRRWYLGSGAVEDVERVAGWSQWFGDLPGGHLVGRWTGAGVELAVVAAGRAEPIGSVAHPIQVITIAPGQRRLAWIDDDGFRGRIIVRDLDRTGTIASAPIEELTGVTWTADDRLLYSTGSGDRPAVWALAVGAGVLGAPARVWGRDRGWFGNLAFVHGRLRLVDTDTTFAVRWIDRGDQAASRELDAAVASDALGWSRTGAPLGWQRDSGKVATLAIGAGAGSGSGSSTATATATPLPATLDGDIGNVTRSGDLLIASIRRPAGRELVAVSLADGARKWTLPAGTATGVRCAGDDHPPCVVFGKAADGTAILSPIDPDTGAIGAALPAPARVEDVAISADGAELIACDGGANLVRLALGDPAATALTPYAEVPLATCRSLALDPRGGVLVTGGKKAQLYQLIHVEPGQPEVVVAQSSIESLSVPRPSPDGRYILLVSRRFLPALYEVRGVR